MSRIYPVLFAWPHSDRFAIFMNISMHLPSRTRTSIFELTVHFELAELCLSVRVPSQGCTMSMYRRMCIYLSPCEWPSCSHGLLGRLCSRVQRLLVPVPRTTSHIMSFDF